MRQRTLPDTFNGLDCGGDARKKWPGRKAGQAVFLPRLSSLVILPLWTTSTISATDRGAQPCPGGLWRRRAPRVLQLSSKRGPKHAPRPGPDDAVQSVV